MYIDTNLKESFGQIFCSRGRPVEQFYWTSSRFQGTSNRNSTERPVEIFIAFLEEIGNSRTFETIVCYLVYILDRMIMLGHKIPDILQFNWNFVPVLDHFSNFGKIALGHIIPEVLLIGWILKLSLDCINIYSYYYSKEAKSLGTFVLPASQSCSISLSIRIKFPPYIYIRALWCSWQSAGFPRD